jgi:hypothetical protein
MKIPRYAIDDQHSRYSTAFTVFDVYRRLHALPVTLRGVFHNLSCAPSFRLISDSNILTRITTFPLGCFGAIARATIIFWKGRLALPAERFGVRIPDEGALRRYTLFAYVMTYVLT